MANEATEKKKVSKKQQAHVKKYMNGHYDRIEILVPKGQRAEIAAAAAMHGVAVGEYIKEAIRKRMAEEGLAVSQEIEKNEET